MKKVYLKFYPNLKKKSSKSKRIPIYIRIIKNGLKAESRLHFDLAKNELKNWNKDFQRLIDKKHVVNLHLETVQAKFNNLVAVEYERVAGMSAQDIRDEILGVGIEKAGAITVKDFMWNYFNEEIKGSSAYAESTMINYRKAFRHMDRFLNHNYPRLTFRNVDYKMANSFKNYLLSDFPDLKKTKMSEVSACGIIKKFRKLSNHALRSGLLETNPFKEIKLSYVSPEKVNFNIQDVPKLFNSDHLTNYELMNLQLFNLMCLTGCAFQDCQELNKLNIVSFENKETLLSYKRNKTEHVSKQFLTRQANAILDAFSKLEKTEVTFQISNQYFNRTLKTIGQKKNIKMPLTSHLARSIYNQLLNEADISDSLLINKLMGWSSKNRIESRYRGITENKLMEAKLKLQFFLDNLLA